MPNIALFQAGGDIQPERDCPVIQQAESWSTALHKDSRHIPTESEEHEVPGVADFSVDCPS
jgi:hypothetical protein